MTATSSPPGWVLWAGTVGLTGSVDERVRAAVAARCTRVSMCALDVETAKAGGRTAADLGRAARDARLEVLLDPVMGWHPGPSSPVSRFARFSLQDALQVALELQVVGLTVIAGPRGSVDPASLVGPFAAVCDRMADHGVQVMLEFIPMSAVPDLATAWGIVGAADRANGGLLLDTWHFFRSDPDFDLLEKVPGGKIYSVQVDDALAEPLADLREDTLNRLLPGEGSFDLDRVIQVLDRTGGLSWIGAEVLSPVVEAMGPELAAVVATDLVRDLVARVRQPA